MKKYLSQIALILCLAFALSACQVQAPTDEPTDTPTDASTEVPTEAPTSAPSADKYEITSIYNQYMIKVGETRDLKTFFSIKNTTSGELVAVTDAMIDAPDADFTRAGMFAVTCKYGDAVKSIIIVVEAEGENITEEPSASPSEDTTENPTGDNAETPSDGQIEDPSEEPSENASENTSENPSENTSETPSENTSENPSETPSEAPSEQPSETPSEPPSEQPSETPSEKPSEQPSETPSEKPSEPTEPKPQHAGTKADPYTVADAMIVLESLVPDLSGRVDSERVYVQGIVTNAGTLKNNTYFRGLEIADESGSSITLYINTANPNKSSDKNISVGDIILLDGFLRFTSNAPEGEMGSSIYNEYTYFSIVGSAPAEKMPTQTYDPGNHIAGDTILYNAIDKYIEDNPYNEYIYANGLRSQGEQNVLVIPVQFKNDSFTSTELADLETAFNGTPEQTGWHSVKSYYYRSSYGKLDLTFDIYSTPVTMPNNYSYYETDIDASTDMLEYALAAVDSSVDLSDYDTNNDGYIDAVYIIYSAPVNYDDDSSNYWAFVSWQGNGSAYDGVYAHYYLFAGVDFMYEEVEGYGSIDVNAVSYIHETAHMLGIDDYYDYYVGTGSDEGLANADIMDYTVGDHNPYTKLLMGWVTPTVITSTQTVTIDAFESSGVFIMLLLDYDGTYFSEYLLIDLYSATGINEMHASVTQSYLYDGEEYGARIYHVSSNIKTPYADEYGSFTSNNNSISDIPLIKMVEADGDDNYESDTYEGYPFASYDDLWQTGDSLGENQAGFTRHDGKLVNFDISFDEVTATGATITITFE